MSIIYLIGKSLFNARTVELYFNACTLQARQGQDVSIILLQDGVLIAPRGNLFERELVKLKRDGVKILFRKEDLTARGISESATSPAGIPIETSEMMAKLAGATTIVSVL